MFRGWGRTVLAAAVVAAAVVAGLLVGGSSPTGARGDVASALSALPASTTVAGFTDWAYVAQHGSLQEAIERDLVTRSAMLDAASGLRSVLDVRLSDLQWEVYGLGGFGEAAVLRLKNAPPSDRRLRSQGYRLDAKTGVWSATGRLAAQETLYGHVAVMPRDDVLILASRPGAAAAVRATVAGRKPSFVSDRAVADAVVPLGDMHTALVQTQGLGCEATSLDREPETARQAEIAQQRFGRLTPYGVLGRGLRDQPGDTQQFVLAMTFPSAVTASEQAQTRAALSQGPFIGRSGAFDEVLRLRSATSAGSTAVLTYDHPADAEYLMTGQGPLLPGSC